MKTRILTVVFLFVTVFLPSAVLGEAGSKNPTDFIKRWAAAISENSADKQLSFYDKSESTEMIVSSGRHYRGITKIEEVQAESFKVARFSDSEAKEIKTRVVGESAIITFEHHFKILILANGSKWKARIRTSTVLHMIDGKWKIVLEHSSPIYGVERMTPIEK